MTKSVDGHDKATLCAKKRMPALEFPGGDRHFLIHDQKCVNRNCAECPIHNFLSMKCDTEWDNSEP